MLIRFITPEPRWELPKFIFFTFSFNLSIKMFYLNSSLSLPLSLSIYIYISTLNRVIFYDLDFPSLRILSTFLFKLLNNNGKSILKNAYIYNILMHFIYIDIFTSYAINDICIMLHRLFYIYIFNYYLKKKCAVAYLVTSFEFTL